MRDAICISALSHLPPHRVNPIRIDIHIFLGRSHKNTNTVFCPVNPVYDMAMYIFKATVYIKQAKYE